MPTSRALVLGLVALGFVTMFVSTSVKSVYQVYFTDLAAHFGGSRANLAWSGSLFMLVTGLCSPLVGGLADRYGPLRTVAVGAWTAGGALIGASLFDGSWLVFVGAYGLCGAFGLAAMTYVPMSVLVDRLFEERKTGFAYAVVTNGTAIGFIVLSPFWLWLAPQADWTSTFLVTGVMLAGPLACAAWFAARRAEALGAGGREPSDAPPVRAWQLARSDFGFLALALGFFGCGATMAFIDVHVVAFWQDIGVSREQMAWSLSLLGVLELVSGLATGWLAMRFSKNRLLAGFYLLRAIAMLSLLSAMPQMRSVGFAVLFGASYLGTVVLTSMYCLERYGLLAKGRMFGLLFLVHQLGAFASVQLGALCFDAFGHYEPLLVALAALTAAGGVVSWVGLRTPAPTLRESGRMVAVDR